MGEKGKEGEKDMYRKVKKKEGDTEREKKNIINDRRNECMRGKEKKGKQNGKK